MLTMPTGSTVYRKEKKKQRIYMLNSWRVLEGRAPARPRIAGGFKQRRHNQAVFPLCPLVLCVVYAVSRARDQAGKCQETFGGFCYNDFRSLGAPLWAETTLGT
jgi:hypothetical protein